LKAIELDPQADLHGTSATPLYLRWSEWSITFDRTNHPDQVVKAGRFHLVVSAVIETVRMTKILMDEGNGINILYKDAFDKLKWI
jgi:hypothetical protein